MEIAENNTYSNVSADLFEEIKEFEQCIFQTCNFSSSNLSGLRFEDCIFRGCDLSMADLKNTVLNEVQFKDCKLLGVQFNSCRNFLFKTDFEECKLNLSSFYKLNLKATSFKNTDASEVDFSEADLSDAVFLNCNLQGAIFEYTKLLGADLRTAYNYSIDPEKNFLKKAKFSIPAVTGLLEKYGIEIE